MSTSQTETFLDIIPQSMPLTRGILILLMHELAENPIITYFEIRKAIRKSECKYIYMANIEAFRYDSLYGETIQKLDENVSLHIASLFPNVIVKDKTATEIFDTSSAETVCENPCRFLSIIPPTFPITRRYISKYNDIFLKHEKENTVGKFDVSFLSDRQGEKYFKLSIHISGLKCANFDKCAQSLEYLDILAFDYFEKAFKRVTVVYNDPTFRKRIKHETEDHLLLDKE